MLLSLFNIQKRRHDKEIEYLHMFNCPRRADSYLNMQKRSFSAISLILKISSLSYYYSLSCHNFKWCKYADKRRIFYDCFIFTQSETVFKKLFTIVTARNDPVSKTLYRLD